MRVAVRCDVSDAIEAMRRLETWIDDADGGAADGDEMVAELGRIADLVDAQRVALNRALGR